MQAHAHDLHPSPPATRPARPPLRALPPPHPRPRRRPGLPGAATVALYALGLTGGLLLAALASLPAGGGIVAGQLRLAGVAVAVGGLALLRARAVARRSRRRRPAGAL